jgi:GNAT superfamily N-acetyltransferase
MLLNQVMGDAPVRVDRLTVETLSVADVPAISGHLKRLEEFDRYSRFFSAMSDESIDRYVSRLDWSRMIAVGLYHQDDLLGIAELGWAEGARSDSAEMAVTVDSAYRHRGIAGWLVNEAVQRGRKAGVRRMEATWVGGNDSIAKIMRGRGAHVWLNGSHWCGIAEFD